MVVPIVHPLHDAFLNTVLPNATAAGNSCILRAPVTGIMYWIGAVLGSALTTADLTVTTTINGNPITTSTGATTFTIPLAGSAAMVQNQVHISRSNLVSDSNLGVNDQIRWSFSGGTGGGPVTVWAFFRRGNELCPAF